MNPKEKFIIFVQTVIATGPFSMDCALKIVSDAMEVTEVG